MFNRLPRKIQGEQPLILTAESFTAESLYSRILSRIPLQPNPFPNPLTAVFFHSRILFQPNSFTAESLHSRIPIQSNPSTATYFSWSSSVLPTDDQKNRFD